MLYFDCDYMQGACPEIMQRLVDTNFAFTSGYGNDEYCESAKKKIREACGNLESDIYFLVGGTQTNATVIDALLRNYEGVIACDSAHINVHESGAIEANGHKILTLPNKDGKLDANALRNYLEAFYKDETYEHMVIPGMVCITHPSESGTLYTEEELKNLHEVCKEYRLPLYLDGARLGYGLAASNEVTLKTIAKYCDAFYIGGTKVGALFGEALVLRNKQLIPHFFTTIKQHGALLAKGRLLGIQFDTLFTDDLYLEISKNAIDKAMKLRDILKEKNYCFYRESPTNQQFIIMENTKMQELSKKVSFGFWENYDEEHTVVRFTTSWATTNEEIEALANIL